MNIIVVTRCLNGRDYIDRFMKGYDFADRIIISEGGSVDGSAELFQKYPKAEVVPFPIKEVINGHEWNPDALHIQAAIDEGLKYNPDWIILDDLDCAPNFLLRQEARLLLSQCDKPQVNAFRLYLWNDNRYFPSMNNYFDIKFTSLWAWRPDEINITTDKDVKHGTLVGLTDDHCNINIPFCLLHKSWDRKTITAKMKRYNEIGMEHHHPFQFAGKPVHLPEWACE